MAGKRKKLDWDAIEKDFRLGQKTIRTIASEHNIVHSTISRKAKKEGWVQDKSQEVRERTNAGLLVQEDEKSTKDCTTRTNPTPDDINRAVQTNIQVIKSHRKDIRRSQKLVALLSNQLNEAATGRDELETEIDQECTKADGKGRDLRKYNRMMRMVALPAHAAVLRDLSTAQKNLIALERQAFNLNEADDTPNDLSELLKEIAGATRGIGNNRKIQE